MRILTHLCCGPCGITVLQRLQCEGHELTGLFFNPNIHPLTEYLRRREGAVAVCARLNVPLLLENACQERQNAAPAPPEQPPPLPSAVDPRSWLRLMAGREHERCPLCWRLRLGKTVDMALAGGFAGFTTSLLYSRHQNHEAIRLVAESLAEASGLSFAYQDFRSSWREGVELSKAWEIYRQPYCGCIYSEYERYARDGAKLWGA